jgi:alpha-tubulin suppressor-like RCC1 family protein|eukprot:COSAG06_NODE_2306_length_7110_cov_99.335188_8_plen_117_part_00
MIIFYQDRLRTNIRKTQNRVPFSYSTKDSPKPTVVKLGTALAAQVACGGVHSLVRMVDGRVCGFGKNWCGQLGLNDGRTTCKKTPVQVRNKGLFVVAAPFCAKNDDNFTKTGSGQT